MRDLCESAKKGHPCIDDLCHNAALCGGDTLCGFNQSEYDEISREYFADDDDCEMDVGELRE
jgi:hypothetical protein